jgi:hypothetical protein
MPACMRTHSLTRTHACTHAPHTLITPHASFAHRVASCSHSPSDPKKLKVIGFSYTGPDGCDWMGPASQQTDHLEECLYSIVECALGCGAHVQRRHAPNHALVCPNAVAQGHASVSHASSLASSSQLQQPTWQQRQQYHHAEPVMRAQQAGGWQQQPPPVMAKAPSQDRITATKPPTVLDPRLVPPVPVGLFSADGNSRHGSRKNSDSGDRSKKRKQSSSVTSPPDALRIKCPHGCGAVTTQVELCVSPPPPPSHLRVLCFLPPPPNPPSLPPTSRATNTHTYTHTHTRARTHTHTHC